MEIVLTHCKGNRLNEGHWSRFRDFRLLKPDMNSQCMNFFAALWKFYSTVCMVGDGVAVRCRRV